MTEQPFSPEVGVGETINWGVLVDGDRIKDLAELASEENQVPSYSDQQIQEILGQDYFRDFEMGKKNTAGLIIESNLMEELVGTDRLAKLIVGNQGKDLMVLAECIYGENTNSSKVLAETMRRVALNKFRSERLAGVEQIKENDWLSGSLDGEIQTRLILVKGNRVRGSSLLEVALNVLNWNKWDIDLDGEGPEIFRTQPFEKQENQEPKESKEPKIDEMGEILDLWEKSDEGEKEK